MEYSRTSQILRQKEVMTQSLPLISYCVKKASQWFKNMKKGPIGSKVWSGLKVRTWIKGTCCILRLCHYKECYYQEQKQNHERQPLWGKNEVYFRHTECEVMIGKKKKKEQVKYTVKIQSKCYNTEQYYNEDSEETVVCQTEVR